MARQRKQRGADAIGYVRYSTILQSSIPEQMGINTELAGEFGTTIVDTFKDPDTSRSIADRPGLRDMFDYVRAHPEIGFIVVNELPRLTAGSSQRAEITRLCQQENVWIITEEDEPIDPFDEEAMHRADENAVKASGETLKVRRRTRRNLRMKIIGGVSQKRPPFGVRVTPLVMPDGTVLPSGARYVDSSGKVVRSGQLEIHPDEIKWLRKIFEWADADVGGDEIARRLTAAGIPTKSGRSSWRGNTIAGILDNPFYKGVEEWGRQAVKRYADGTTYLEQRPEGDRGRVVRQSKLGAIIDPELWDRLHERRLGRRGERRSTRKEYGPLVLDGLVYCGRCGYRMYARNDSAGKVGANRKPGFRWVCDGRGERVAKPDFAAPCRRPLHSLLEKKILAALGTLAMDGGSAKVRPRRTGSDTTAQRKVLDGKIAAEQAKLTRAQDLAVDGLISKAELKLRKAKIDGDIAELQQQLAQLEQDTPAAAAPSPYAYVGQVDFAELAELLGDLTLPAADRAQALRDAGISRIYIDSPLVEVEFVDGNAGLQSGLLGAQHGDRRVSA